MSEALKGRLDEKLGALAEVRAATDELWALQ